MNNFLVRHALDHVWCAPRQDHQEWLEATRLTDEYGGLKSIRLYGRNISFPVVAGVKYFHFYHLGRFPEQLLNADGLSMQWTRLKDLSMDRGVLIQLVLMSGIVVPIERGWIKRSFDRGIYLAVELHKDDQYGMSSYYDAQTNAVYSVPRKIGREQLFIRFYSNAVVGLPEWSLSHTGEAAPYRQVTLKVNGLSDWQVYRQAIADILSAFDNEGMGYELCDGYRVLASNQAFSNDVVGKTWTYVHDLTVDDERIYSIKDLTVFNSELDQKPKLLVFGDVHNPQTRYQDDADFFLFCPLDQKGVYVPRVKTDTVRQVGFNCYAIDMNVLFALVNEHSFSSSFDQLQLIAMTRPGGTLNDNHYNADRLTELYKLPLEDIKMFLNGSQAIFSQWSAKVLENSAVARLARGSYSNVTPSLVEEAYGYHAINKVAYKPYQSFAGASGTKRVQLFPGNAVEEEHTLFNYDTTGLMTGYQSITPTAADVNDGAMNAPDQSVGAVELLYGKVFYPEYETTPCYYGETFTRVDLKNQTFRAYLCLDGNIYEDVTNRPYYTVNGDTFTWNAGVGALGFPKIVRFSDFIACVEKSFDPVAYRGVMRVDFPEYPMDDSPHAAWIGYGNLDVFMNGQPLIEDIDYFVNWPTIVVVKKPDVAVDDVSILVRAYGFADQYSLTHHKSSDVGFVHTGILSADGTFNLRDDRNVRLVVNGRLVDPASGNYSESPAGNPVVDGRPYAVLEYRQDVDRFCLHDTVSLKTEADQIDSVVSEIMGRYAPMQEANGGFVDGARWQVVSPVVSALLHAFSLDNYLGSGVGESPFDNTDVEGWLSPYEHLFEFDPAVHGLDPYYVNILPHQYTNPMTISAGQYQILKYVIRHYLRDLVDLTAMVNIGA